ncbi:MAG TPA: hypothetical protein VMR25_12495, partial [Planctomycetaceae bacterium]|nr:hypothetical protein [Planctomycetaceae bacterium]
MSDERQWDFWRRTTLDVEFDPDITFDKWLEFGTSTKIVEDACRWQIGAWALFGERKFGEAYSQAITADNAETIRQRRWVYERVPAERRREDLSWSHHRAVAVLDVPEQQDELLALAHANGWTVATLNAAVKETKATGQISQPPAPEPAAEATTLFKGKNVGPSSQTPKADTPAEPAAPFRPQVVAGRDVDPLPLDLLP